MRLWRAVKRILDFLVPVVDPQTVRPEEWHITETYRGLITLSVDFVKMLALINGGAAVALLAYLGSFAAHASSGQHPPHLMHALIWFCKGLSFTASGVGCAYLTQLRLYNEERRRHDGKRFAVWHPWILATGLVLAGFAIFAFSKGCWAAAAAIRQAVY